MIEHLERPVGTGRLTPAQLRTLRAYLATGSARGAAELLVLSIGSVENNLALARDRVGAKNVAQLVYLCHDQLEEDQEA